MLGLQSLQVWQFELVQHVLTFGFAAMGAALLYFILTIKDNAPRYRPSSVLSGVVMVSAFLLLFLQAQSWENAFVLEGTKYIASGNSTFTNGFRYLNWLIDVPHLLIQILFVAGIVGVAFRKYLVRFTTSGSLMIITGYIGQFYEPGRGAETDATLWLIWGGISTLFYIWVLVLITQVIKEGRANMKGSKAEPLFAAILPLFYVAWTIYPVAYVMPIFNASAEIFALAIVSQQVLYTIADVTSKIFYGVMLNVSSTRLSIEQGYEPAA